MRIGFGAYVLDAATRQLSCDGQLLHLSPKAFQLLALLVELRPAVVGRAAVRQRLWPDTHVVDAALGNLVAEIRGVLGQEAARLRTVHGGGYAFDGDARDLATAQPEAMTPPRFWLVWRERALILERTDNVVGRDPSCAVWIDASGVSRRHARIRVPEPGSDEAPVIEDLGSTNGTDVNGHTVTGATVVADGDTIVLGEATLTFRAWRHTDAPTRRVKRPKR